jgi:hypothetical protein
MASIGHPEQQTHDGECQKPFASDIAHMWPQTDGRECRKGDRQKRRPGQNDDNFSKHRTVISQTVANAAVLAMQG